MENVNLLPENEYTEVDGRRYLNPNLPVERTNAFIDNLRTAQQADTQQINTDTQKLGTDVPSDLGGLTGAGSYFSSRYQTPQTNTVVQNLRTAAQADALNQMMQNEQEMWKKKYQDAYRAQQKRSYNRAYNSGSGGNSGGGNNNGNTSGWNGETKKEEISIQERYGVPNAKMTETDTHYIFEDPDTGEKTYVSKDFDKKLYDENGNLTPEGMVILDTRRMLGM